MKLGVYHGEPKVLQFKGDVSVAGLAATVEELSNTVSDLSTAITEGVQTAKDYADEKIAAINNSTDETQTQTETQTETPPADPPAEENQPE